MRTLRKFQTHDLHSKVPALGLCSDYTCLSDGVTASNGKPVHVHVILQEGRGGQLQYQVLGLQPVEVAATLPAALESSSALKFSSRSSLVAHARDIEAQFGLESGRCLRWSGRVADGAEDGVAELQAAKLGMKEPQINLFGQIDIWHCCETAGSHSDALSSLQGCGWTAQYIEVIRRMRAKFNFGVHKSLPTAIAKKYSAPCLALLAPHSQATRTLKHEGVAAAKNFLFNVRNLAYCNMVALQASINSARQLALNPGEGCGLFTETSKACREEGRMVLNAPMLVYVTLRQELREACLTSYATAGQRIAVTSSEAFVLVLSCLRRMRLYQAAARGLCGLVEIWDNILDCLAGTDIPRSERLTQASLQAFLSVLAQKVSGKCFPKGGARILELIRHRTIFGLPCGLQRGTVHPFSEPLRRSDSDGRAALLARQRETAPMCRKRLVSSLLPALRGFLAHSRNEIFFFKSRCLFHFSNWPLKTCNDVWRYRGGTVTVANDEPGVEQEPTAVEQEFPAVATEEEDDPAFDPSVASQHRVFHTIRLEGGAAGLEGESLRSTEVAPEVMEPASDESDVPVLPLSAVGFSLPCANDAALATLMRRTAQSKAGPLTDRDQCQGIRRIHVQKDVFLIGTADLFSCPPPRVNMRRSVL